MQALVYTLIGLAAAAIGATAYFGLTFTPAEAILCAIVFGCVCFVLMERTLRQRAEARLEKAIEDLSRLLATDAQAGAVLGQRINALSDINAGSRLEGVEADISVLGTVIRQVAEAVAEMEEKVTQPARGGANAVHTSVLVPPAPEREPIISTEALRQALAQNRLIYHIQPLVSLPQRRTQAYELVPRLMLEDGDLAESADFLPRRGAVDLVSLVEGVALVEAVTLARRARSAGKAVSFYIPLTRASLSEKASAEQVMASLEANRAIASSLIFLVPEREWAEFTTAERAIADSIAKKGARFSIDRITTLRVNVAELAAQGVQSLRIDAASFIATPEAFTDFHASDIAGYLARFEVKLVGTGISGEGQIVELIDDGITLAQGPHIAPPGPIRPDLFLEAVPQLRRVEA